MIGFFVNYVRGPIVAVLAICSVAYGVFLLQLLPMWSRLKEAAGGTELQETFFYTGARANSVIAAYDGATREAARIFYALDAINALLFALSIAALMAFALRRMNRETSLWRWAIALPLACGLFDLIENGLLAFFNESGGANVILGTIAGGVTAIKLATGFAAIPIMLIMLFIAGMLYTRGQLDPD